MKTQKINISKKEYMSFWNIKNLSGDLYECEVYNIEFLEDEDDVLFK